MTAAEKITTADGLAVSVKVKVDDFEAMGRWWAGVCSDQQAQFLIGVAEGFTYHDSIVPQQAFIAGTARALHLDTELIRLWAQTLADQMEVPS